VNVANQRSEYVVVLNQERPVPAFEEVSTAAVLAVKPARVSEEQVMGNVRQRHVGDFDNHVDMIGHPAICVAAIAEALDTFAQVVLEGLAIVRVREDGLAVVTASDEVVEGSAVVLSGSSPHL